MGWIKLWHQGPAQILPAWFPEDHPTFSVLQYQGLSQEQLRAKIAEFPRGMNVTFQFWQPGQIQPPVSMEKQEAVYQRLKAVAVEHGIVLAKTNHP